jgi:hypothetical protein
MLRVRLLLVLGMAGALCVAAAPGAAASPALPAPLLPIAASESLPGWAIPLIVAAVIALAVAIYFLTRRREEE